MEPGEAFTEFQDEAYTALVSTTKAAGRLAAEDIPFHRSLDPNFAKNLDTCNQQILGLVNSLLRNATQGTDVSPPKLKDADDVESKWNDVIEIVDFLLEKTDTCLDEYTGAIKQKNPEPLPGARRHDHGKKHHQKPNSASMFKNHNLPKPQINFRTKVNNNDNTPWKPLLTSKPHAVVPLEHSLRTFVNDNLKTQYHHPYQPEIQQLQYPKHIFTPAEPIEYLPFRDTSATYVDTEEGLMEMLNELRQATEIAVDLEHHSERSFVGIVCLMQISTRQRDWIIDTLKLRAELQVLNEVFTDPGIVKVLHGASMDIIWLQRDFGIYVVGLFDTYEAACALGFQWKSLAFLLKKFVNFDADKQYQLADWRIRPLPREMLDYARSDTHFLLYCFDKVRNLLLGRTSPEEDFMQQVLCCSKETSLRRYEREEYDFEQGVGPFGWASMLRKDHVTLTIEQLAVFRAVHQWRDKVARAEDDSHSFVMPRHQIYNLARNMPDTVPGVFTYCHPASPHVRMRVSEIISIIKAARESVAPELATETPTEVEPSAIGKTDSPSTAALLVETQKKFQEIDIFDTAEPCSLRSPDSNFWGNSLLGSKLADKAVKQMAIMKLAVPLPPLTGTVFADPNEPIGTTTPQTSNPGARAEHEYVKKRPRMDARDNEVFVVKDIGGGRKRKRDKAEEETADDQTTSTATDQTAPADTTDVDFPGQPLEEDEIAVVEAFPSRNSQRKERKKKKKLAKEEAQLRPRAEDEGSTSGSAAPFVPFDYSKAPSVLKAGETGYGGRAGAFNPYKGLGPKGGKKGRREREGRAFTFKK